MIGQKLLHYHILEKLGEGGMGAVYKARDTHLNRFVAVKVLTKGQISSPEQRQRFVNEARSASALNHPNIVHIYDIGNEAGIDFIAMEFVDGKTLLELSRRKALTLPKALKYAIQVADALNKAHAAGIVHRDLKPSNVMVNDDGVVKLLDFGLAKLVEVPGSSDNLATRTAIDMTSPTQEGVIVGTAAYMSPEQAECKPLDARADIFSFGALLYEMVSGQRAFPGDSHATMLVAIMTKEPPPLSQIPRPVDKVIQRCLRKSPAERWHSIADVKMALEDLYHDYSTASGEMKRVLPPKRPIALLTGLGMLVVLILVVVLIFFPFGSDPVPDLNPRPLTTYAGDERHPTLSPDGSQVAFSWNGVKQDNDEIYVQHLPSGTLLPPLTDDPAEDDHPAWSPDGRWIAFHRHFRQHWVGLYLISPLGGQAKKLWEADLISRLSWSPDGKWLLLSIRQSEELKRGIFLYSIDTQEKRRLTSPPAEGVLDSDGAISPNGRKLVFVRGSYNLSGLYVMDLDKNLQPTGTATAIPVRPEWYCYNPVWTPNGRYIIFSGGTMGNHSLWRVRSDGSQPPQRLGSAGDVGLAELTLSLPTKSSPARLAYSRRLDDYNIWRVGLKNNGGEPERLIESTRNDMNAKYSPDGRSIAFESARSGDLELWTADANGEHQTNLTSMASYSASPSWSPDGKRIAYESNAGDHWNIFTIGATGENRQQLTKGPEIDSVPSWSRDGKWIYFASKSTGAYRVCKLPSAGGDIVPVTSGNGYMATESPDGQSLIYTRDGGDPTSLWILTFATGEEKKIAVPVQKNSFVPVQDGVYYVAAGTSRALTFLNFKTGKSTILRTFERNSVPGIDISPDGSYLLFARKDQSGTDLMLAEGFR